MSCLQNIDKFVIPNDIVVMLSKIYKYIGNNNFYKNVINSDCQKVLEQTIEKDAYYFARLFKFDISDTRLRLIITKDSSPRNKEESALFNTKELLTMLQKKYNLYGFQSNDILNLINYIYKQNIKFDYTVSDKRTVLQSQSNKSKRLLLDDYNQIIEKNLHYNTYEKFTLYIHYFIDVYNLKPFTNHNEEASLLTLYQMILKSEMEVFQYTSFFEKIFRDYNNFENELKKASINWQEGYSHTFEFVRYMCKLILTSYNDLESMIKNYKYEKNNKKSENIESTILSMPEIFTKEEIRLVHPYVSDSTINRALMSLRDDGYIAPLGKGRSAKWIRKSRGYNNG